MVPRRGALHPPTEIGETLKHGDHAAQDPEQPVQPAGDRQPHEQRAPRQPQPPTHEPPRLRGRQAAQSAAEEIAQDEEDQDEDENAADHRLHTASRLMGRASPT